MRRPGIVARRSVADYHSRDETSHSWVKMYQSAFIGTIRSHLRSAARRAVNKEGRLAALREVRPQCLSRRPLTDTARSEVRSAEAAEAAALAAHDTIICGDMLH